MGFWVDFDYFLGNEYEGPLFYFVFTLSPDSNKFDCPTSLLKLLSPCVSASDLAIV